MKNKKLLVLCIPIVILILMSILPFMTYLTGDTIILKTRPYDPRDLFRGDYVVLSYEIERINVDKFRDDIIVNNKGSYIQMINDVYVVLKESDEIHTVDYVTKDKPKGKKYLSAEIVGVINAHKNNSGEPAVVVVDYGLDSYFVPENTGRELEKMSREGELLVEIKTLGNYAILKSVYPME